MIVSTKSRRRKVGPRKAVIMASIGILCLGCCPAWRPNADGVRIADQEVLIWWDSANGMEHFVRRANFEAESVPEDFGFLVPTPSQPKLGETPDRVFYQLSRAIRPEIQYQDQYRPKFLPAIAWPFYQLMSSVDMPTDSAGSVEVLETTFVGGFEASVLRANEVNALLTWLEENDYDARPELREWVEPYIAKQWIITAFKYDCEPGARERSLARAAVCMSFPTDKPFFPYRVPSDQVVAPEDGSLLRLYFAGDERIEGQFENGKSAWSAGTRFSAPVDDAAGFLAGIEGAGYSNENTEPVWLTAFEDKAWPGGMEDLYFQASGDSGEVRPPPIIRERTNWIWIPSDIVLGIGVVGFLVFRRRRLKRTDSMS